MYQTLISAAQLKGLQQANNTNLVILDSRFNLMDVAQGRMLFLSGHIPTAQYVDLNSQLSSEITAESGRHPLPSKENLISLFSTLGIDSEVQVVVYDDCSGAMAARAWWLLRWMGQHNVAVLDGGIQAWQQADYALASDEAEAVETRQFKMNSSDFIAISTAQVLGGHYQLVDARAQARFNGEQEPIDKVAGHIPGAQNRPFPSNLTPDGVFKESAVLANELQKFDRENVAQMCGSGVTACHNILAMCHAGLAPSKLYVGSWSEWIVDPAREVARVK